LELINIEGVPLYIGTSGYKYEDWRGTFYKKNITPYEMLIEYSKHFNFMELTFTFYKMPILKTVESIAQRVKDKTKISIRLNKVFLKGAFSNEDVKLFKDAIKPFIEKDIAIAYLCDFSPKFSASKANLDLMLKLKKIFYELPIFFELQNRTWYKERYLEDMRSSNLGIVILDMPEVKGLAPYYPITTNSNTYIRLYGKSRLWLTPTSKELNYLYSEEEMKKIYDDLKRLSIVSNNVFVSFCNLEDGKAAINALNFKKLAEKM